MLRKRKKADQDLLFTPQQAGRKRGGLLRGGVLPLALLIAIVTIVAGLVLGGGRETAAPDVGTADMRSGDTVTVPLAIPPRSEH